MDIERMHLTTECMKIVYHRADYDGLFSAIAVKLAAEMSGEYDLIDLMGYNYGDESPIHVGSEFRSDRIIIVDVTLPVEVMKYLHEKMFEKVIWIDHHDTAIKDSIEHGYSDFKGIRESGTAACVLTWKFFHPLIDLPKVYALIGANDVWDHDSFDWDEEVQPIQYALRTKYQLDIKKLYANIGSIIGGGREYSLIEFGKPIMEYEYSKYKSWCKNNAFEVTIDGKHKAICMLTNLFTSKVFDSIKDDYEFYVVANKSTDCYRISIYTSNEDFHCGEYMKEHYNGGGHSGAAGGTLTEKEFVKLVTKGKV